LVSSNVIVVPYSSSGQIIQNLRALDLENGETIWEVTNISLQSSFYASPDMFFIDQLYENNSYYIMAISEATGETVWKRRVGDSYGKILAIKDNKLFVNSENFKIIGQERGATLAEYSITLDPSLLEYFPAAISNNTIYVVTTGPSPYIYAINLSTGKLLWKGENGGISPYFYKNRLYLINYGKLYAYEHGVETAPAWPTEKAAGFELVLAINALLIIAYISGRKRTGAS